jgi:hypothetical protein
MRISRRDFRRVRILLEGRSAKELLRGPDGKLYLFKPDAKKRWPPVEARRSVAFAVLARIVDVDTPVIREVKLGRRKGSLQDWREDIRELDPLFDEVPGQDDPKSTYNRSNDRVTVADYLTVIFDRHTGNKGIHRDDAHVVAHDNEFAFWGNGEFPRLTDGQRVELDRMYGMREDIFAAMSLRLKPKELNKLMFRLERFHELAHRDDVGRSARPVTSLPGL